MIVTCRYYGHDWPLVSLAKLGDVHTCGRCAATRSMTTDGASYAYPRVTRGTFATAAEFEAAYAARSGVSVEFFRKRGRYPEYCACGGASCEGWVMGHQHDEAIVENQRMGHQG